MEKPQLQFAQATDITSDPEGRQDVSLALTMHGASNFGVTDIGFFMIADGMGNNDHGQKAAAFASRTIAYEITKRVYLPSVSSSADKSFQEITIPAFQQANAVVRQHYPETGITATAVLIIGNLVHVAHIGNARLFLIGDKVEQLTRDQLSSDDLHDMDISQNDKHLSPTRTMVGQALGLSQAVSVDTLTKPLTPGARLLLCSDGLNIALEDENMLSSIQQVALRQPNLNRACELILTLARNQDSHNEMSIILVKTGS